LYFFLNFSAVLSEILILQQAQRLIVGVVAWKAQVQRNAALFAEGFTFQLLDTVFVEMNM
jgi:hypothetical protein